MSGDRVLVAWIPNATDLRYFEEEHWYRIPLDVKLTQLGEWRRPGWVAAFEGARASGSRQQVARYARVLDIVERTRAELLGGEAAGPKQGRRYYQLKLGPVQYREPLVPSRNRRRTTFVWTKLRKLLDAQEFNDIFDDSPFENQLWDRFKEEGIAAERQWPESVDGRNYVLDFALFCRKRNLDLEVDGVQHHSVQANSEHDSDRDSDLGRKGWAVHRIRVASYRRDPNGQFRQLCESIEQYGGVESSGGQFIPTRSGVVKQLRLLEQPGAYDTGGGDTR